MNRSIAIFGLIATLGAGAALAQALPPELIHYQGVLRDANGNPREGGFDMVFRLWSAETGGDEILEDHHTGMSRIYVDGGLFEVWIGAGTRIDGSGPGSYVELLDVFRDYGEVWLEIQVDSETLTPRVRLGAAAYALNAGHASWLGGKRAGDFLDTSAMSQEKVGSLTLTAPSGYGLTASGSIGGGYFNNPVSGSLAYLASTDRGIEASGSSYGGIFRDSDSSGYAYLGFGDTGIQAHGTGLGAFIYRSPGTWAYIASGNYGIQSHGEDVGGYFRDSNQSGAAYLGYGDEGIRAFGYRQAGYFEDTDSSGLAYLGYGDFGIQAFGDTTGGYFSDTTGGAYAYLAYGQYGGYFRSSSRCSAATGSQSYGIEASCQESPSGGSGAIFRNESLQYAILAGSIFTTGLGIEAKGWEDGGFIGNTYFGNYVYIATSDNKKVKGPGSVSFVQNHPHQSDLTVTYNAPEGDEVATYTRGSARLSGGEARVRLGSTFAWVTNPDLGLTAHVTPRGPCSGLYVAAISTEELVVRSVEPNETTCLFDYLVYGLRIGFENVAIVTEKVEEARVPSMDANARWLTKRPELAEHTAWSRFSRMSREADAGFSGDSTRATALLASIGVFDPEKDELLGPSERISRSVETAGGRTSPDSPDSLSRQGERGTDDSDRRDTGAGTLPQIAPSSLFDPESDGSARHYEIFDAAGAISPGDVVVVAEQSINGVQLGSRTADPRVVGIAAQASSGGLVPVSVVGVVLTNADAGYGAIRAGDLLTTSPTPGHARLALEALPGTIVGKALESLDTGTGVIKVLVMLR